MLSLLHHQNLVSLIGYCADGDQRLLVYEYMAFGSLEDHLHGKMLLFFPVSKRFAQDHHLSILSAYVCCLNAFQYLNAYPIVCPSVTCQHRYVL